MFPLLFTFPRLSLAYFSDFSAETGEAAASSSSRRRGRYVSVERFLGNSIDVPNILQTYTAIANLIESKAIYIRDSRLTSSTTTSEGVRKGEVQYGLTPLGYHLAKLPMDIKIGKMLIYATLLEVRLASSSRLHYSEFLPSF
jgi:hypothetical protein